MLQGLNVEISGGTKFYLIAPLNQAENVSATFSSKMKGSIDKEYSAIRSQQDLGHRTWLLFSVKVSEMRNMWILK